MYGAPELDKDRTTMWASADCYALSLTCLQLMAGQTLDDFYVQGGWDYEARPPLRPCSTDMYPGHEPALPCLTPFAKHAQPHGT